MNEQAQKTLLEQHHIPQTFKVIVDWVRNMEGLPAETFEKVRTAVAAVFDILDSPLEGGVTPEFVNEVSGSILERMAKEEDADVRGHLVELHRAIFNDLVHAAIRPAQAEPAPVEPAKPADKPKKDAVKKKKKKKKKKKNKPEIEEPKKERIAEFVDMMRFANEHSTDCVTDDDSVVLASKDITNALSQRISHVPFLILTAGSDDWKAATEKLMDTDVERKAGTAALKELFPNIKTASAQAVLSHTKKKLRDKKPKWFEDASKWLEDHPFSPESEEEA